MPPFEQQSYAWFAARAKNALRRRLLTGIIASIVFVGSLIGLVLIPRQATRVARHVETSIAERPDTAPLLRRRNIALARRNRIDSSLAVARAKAQHASSHFPSVVDTLSPALIAERDSLRQLLSTLDDAMRRAAGSPLPPAFRALAQTPALRGNAHVRSWLDSLDQLDKLREPFGALGAGDPIYVALSAHINELGRSIRDAAALRRSELRSRIAPLMPAPVPPSVVEAQIDTTPLLEERRLVQRDFVLVTQELEQMRAQNRAIDVSLARARQLANIGAPPLAMLAAALVFAIAIGYGSAFALELKHPRLAHPHEAEVVAGTRVLTVVRPSEVVERSRRESDNDIPPLIELASESYRMLYLHMAASNATVPTITVTGDIPQIVATIASNLSAMAAYEARSTLLVDVDTPVNHVAAVLQIPEEPGLSGYIYGESDWTESLVTVTIGRDRPLDVLPAGNGTIIDAPESEIDRVREDLIRMERRYDFIVITGPTDYVERASNTVIPAQDVIVCARIGETRLSELRAAMGRLREVGRQVHGLVLWDAETPHLSRGAVSERLSQHRGAVLFSTDSSNDE